MDSRVNLSTVRVILLFNYIRGIYYRITLRLYLESKYSENNSARYAVNKPALLKTYNT